MTVQTIELSKIKLGANNPRKEYPQASIERLAASIKQDGLLQNVTVTKKGKKFEVNSGGRRFRALSLLQEQGHIDGTFPVPVLILKSKSANDNLRKAMVENIQREQMHPQEEADAFLTLTKEGVNLEEVATQSGVSLSTIQRRLLLINLSDDSKKLYREGKLNLSQAEALAIGNDEEQQAVIKRMNTWNMDSEDIRDFLLNDKPSVSIALFDKEKYTGTFTTDLFGEEDTTYFDDVGQFNVLQDEAVENLKQEYATTMKYVDWVEIERDNYFSRYGYRDAEEGENGGVIIHYRIDGKVEIHEGLVKRENTIIETTSTSKERPEFSKKAYGHFANQKTILVQHAIAGDFRKAKEVAVLQRINLCRDANIKLHQAVRSLACEQEGSAEYELKSQIEQDLMEFLGIDSTGNDYWYCFFDREYSEYYEAVKSLTDEQLDQLFALLVALSFGQEMLTEEEPENTLFHDVARDLSIEIRDVWTPDEAYFNLLKKDQLLEIAEACGASIGKRLYNLKRKDLIVELMNYFADTKPLQNEEQAELRASFCPNIMQFGINESD